MGQKLRDDKIGTLSHGGGIISLTTSYLTIGGQQYVTSGLNRTISSDVTLVANTRYMIYAVLSGGIPALRISTNANSLGPAGFSSWKLVGAFYSDGMSPVAFGSFVNIEGVPVTNWVSYLPTWGSTGTQPTLGNGTIAGRWKLTGDSQEIHYELNVGSTSTAGTGGYTFSLPHTADPAKMAAANPTSTIIGWAHAQYGNQRIEQVAYGGTNVVYMFSMTDSGANNIDYGSQISATVPTAPVAGTKLAAQCRLPVAGLSNTPLKDL
jgi:hypothetical protein